LQSRHRGGDDQDGWAADAAERAAGAGARGEGEPQRGVARGAVARGAVARGAGVHAAQREKLDAVILALKLSLPTGDTAQIRERMGRVRGVADTVRALGDAASTGTTSEDAAPRRALG
jgi:hypothetical protein